MLTFGVKAMSEGGRMEAVFLCHVVDEGKVAERIQLGPCRGGGSLSLSRTIEFFFFFFFDTWV